MDIALLDHFTENNLIAEQALGRAKRVAEESREEIGDVLSKLGILSEQELVGVY